MVAESIQHYTPRHLADRILNLRSAIEGERKQVTVLFCDIANSTPLAARIGPERMHEVLDGFFKIALTEVHRFEGTVNQFLGDGLMALFGAPLTHEDHARRGVLAALAIRDEVQARRHQIGDLLEGLQIRVGLNTGLVVVGKIGDNLRMDYTAIGDTTNVAARLQAVAEPGTIVIGDEVLRHVRHYVKIAPLGVKTLKGKADPLPLYRVECELNIGANRELPAPTSLVGRGSEIAEIRRCLGNLAERREGCILAIIGDAGLGKTRMVVEARQFARTRSMLWLDAGCVSFGKTFSYLPFRELLRRAFSLDDDASDIENLGRVHAALVDLFDAEVGQVLPFIARIMSLPAEDQAISPLAAQEGAVVGPQVFRSMMNLFERIAARSPVVLALEDWHWADQSSSDLLIHLTQLVARAPIMFLVAMRPEEQGPAAALTASLQKDGAPREASREIRLTALDEQAGSELMEQLLEGGSLPPQLRGQLLNRACGNPFYIGELVRTLIATGAIELDAVSGNWSPTATFDPRHLPDTIEGVILARVDRLQEDAKQVLKTAAVVGRSFFYRVLEAINAEQRNIGAEIAKLKMADLIVQKQQLPELELMFKHPLIQQATYASLLHERRMQLHQQVAACIEALFANRIEEFYSVLAYHYAQAENWNKACDFMFKAGDQAGATAADAEALEHYRMALAATERSGQGQLDRLQRADLDRKIGEALFGLGRHEEAEAHLLGALERVGIRYPSSARAVPRAVMVELLKFALRQLLQLVLRPDVGSAILVEEDRIRFRMINALAWIDFFRDPVRWALDLLNMYKVIEGHPKTGEYVLTCSGVGSLFDGLGLYRFGARFHRRALNISKSLADSLPFGLARLCLGMNQLMTGKFKDALTTSVEAARICNNSGHLLYWAAGFSQAINVKRMLGEPSWMDDIEELRTAGSDAGNELTLSWAECFLAERFEHLGEYDAALVHFDRAAKALEVVGDHRNLAALLAESALVHCKLGHTQRAFELLDQSRNVSQRHRLSGILVSRPVMCRAQVHLWVAETADSAERRRMLESAGRACTEAKRQSTKVMDDCAPDALRLFGIYEWLRGRPAQAEKWWHAAIAMAERLGARHVLGLTHLEFGRRLSDRSHLARAEELLIAAGAAGDLADVRRALMKAEADPPA